MNSTAEAWDRYWTDMLTHMSDKAPRHALITVQIGWRFYPLIDNLDVWRERNVRRVLLPGNGASLLPYALVHVGFDVTVVDVSPVANASVLNTTPAPEILACYLRVDKEVQEKGQTTLVRDKEASLRRVATEAVPGGKATFVTADIMTYEPAEPFDVIFDDRLMQVLPMDWWPDLAQRYAQWLPAGTCLMNTINLGGTFGDDVSATRKPFEAAFFVAGFQKVRGLKSGQARVAEREVEFIYGSG